MPKIVDHHSLRLQLMQDAFELFARQGYATVGMRSIAKELGVSTGTLYHYFATKEALFEQTFSSMSAEIVKQALDYLGPENLAEQRLQLLWQYVKEHEHVLQSLLLLLLDYHRHGSGGKTAAFATNMASYFREMLAENVANDQDQGAEQLLTVLMGYLMHRLIRPDLDPNGLTKLSQSVLLNRAGRP